MTDEELLIALADDKLNMCIDNYMLTNTNFLDLNQQSILKKHLSECKANYEFYGGFKDSERKILLFLPDYIKSADSFSENPDLNPIVQIKILKDGFSSLTHRDYLGAIMGLGIKREMLGDLTVTDYGCITVAFGNIAEYIKDNLISVGRGTVKVEICDSFDDLSAMQNIEQKRCYVSSMRADSVVASVFNLSRTAAVEKIKRSEVFVNDLLIEKNDSKIPLNSKIVVRGKGKAVISSYDGITKKGRHAFAVDLYK